jgi:hypothetical protein
MQLHRTLALLGSATALVALTGCASVTSISSDVASFGEWPADRQPGTYAFERLPSQQAMAAETDQLEAAAAPALAKAGFKPAAAGQAPDVLVQVGARVQRSYDSRWDDRLWWSGGFGYSWGHGYGRRGPWLSPGIGLGWRSDLPRYDREVGVLIRDRASGKALYETRATNEGLRSSDADLQAAMFQAALADFPRLAMNPRRVVVPLRPAQ